MSRTAYQAAIPLFRYTEIKKQTVNVLRDSGRIYGIEIMLDEAVTELWQVKRGSVLGLRAAVLSEKSVVRAV